MTPKPAPSCQCDDCQREQPKLSKEEKRLNKRQRRAWLLKMDRLSKRPCRIVNINVEGIGECHACLTHNDFMSWVVWSDERKYDLPRCMTT